ncbi:MAG TPA: ABC transporter ATP-binding protein, partial [Thalassospira sp.]|nr:ABC transporter ATP-binding protein [Thalassospira sp.]
EPTSALDLHWRMVVLDLVRERLAERGGVVIAALHDLDLAARYCDLIVLLHRGKIIASGTPSEVLTPANLARVYRVETRVT